jgi:hypothetical protein
MTWPGSALILQAARADGGLHPAVGAGGAPASARLAAHQPERRALECPIGPWATIHPHTKARKKTMIILGLVLFVIGLVAAIPILVTIGLVVAVLGLVLMVLGRSGRPVRGRHHYW